MLRQAQVQDQVPQPSAAELSGQYWSLFDARAYRAAACVASTADALYGSDSGWRLLDA